MGNVWGVEWSGECYCGSKTEGGDEWLERGVKVEDKECSSKCKGEEEGACGGYGKVGVYGKVKREE